MRNSWIFLIFVWANLTDLTWHELILTWLLIFECVVASDSYLKDVLSKFVCWFPFLNIFHSSKFHRILCIDYTNFSFCIILFKIVLGRRCMWGTQSMKIGAKYISLDVELNAWLVVLFAGFRYFSRSFIVRWFCICAL